MESTLRKIVARIADDAVALTLEDLEGFLKKKELLTEGLAAALKEFKETNASNIGKRVGNVPAAATTTAAAVAASPAPKKKSRAAAAAAPTDLNDILAKEDYVM